MHYDIMVCPTWLQSSNRVGVWQKIYGSENVGGECLCSGIKCKTQRCWFELLRLVASYLFILQDQ
jgi:hypothetical protein